MDVVAYETTEPVVAVAGADIDPATAAEMVGEQADIRCFDALDATIEACETAERIDCVVTTDELADGTGIELLETLRERLADPDASIGGPHATDLPVIYVPSSGSVPDAEAATAAGATVYLPRDRAAEGELRERLADVVEAYDHRRQLRRERELFDALLEYAPLALYAKDREARYVAASSYIAPGFGDSPLGLTGPEIEQDDPGALESHKDDLELIETGEPIIETVDRTVSADGEVRWIRTTRHPWRTRLGEIQGLVGVGRDITTAKEHEQALERQRWRLQQFATFTSTELREPVTTSLEALETAQAAMDRLDDVDASDANAGTDGVGDRPLPQAADDALAAVDAALEELEALIETVLSMARPQSSAPEPAWIRFESAVEQAWGAIEGAPLPLETRIDEQVEINADPEMLRQLLEHLFRNAIEQPSGDASSGPSLGASTGAASGTEPASSTDDSETEGSTVEQTAKLEPDPAVERITVGLTDGGFYVESVGPGIDPPADPTAEAFEFQGAGYRIAIARDFADAHDWSFDLEEGSDGGVRIVVEDCLLRPRGLADATTGAPRSLSASGDVGGSTPPGDAFQTDDRWVIRAGGRNLWQDVTEFHGAWAPVDGDVRVEAQVTEFEAVHEHSKAGVGLYDPEDSNAPLAAVTVTGGGPTEAIGRPTQGELISSHLTDADTSSGRYLRIDRVGDRVILWTSADGTDWQIVDHRRFVGDERVAAGLLVCSHSQEQYSTATFENVRVAQLEVPD